MKPSNLKSKFGGALRTKSVGGAEIKRGDQDSKMVRNAMSSQSIKDVDLGEVEGGMPGPRLDRPVRAKGGSVKKKSRDTDHDGDCD
jgi:hypothetical protein